MSKPRTKKPVETASVVRRPRDDRKRLPPHLEAFASGDADALWRRETRGGKLNDPRAAALVPGVKNADARAVFDARTKRLRAQLDGGDEAGLARGLAEAHALALFRGHSIVSFEAFVEAVLGIPLDRAEALVATGREATGLGELSEAEIAIWLRAEAGLLEADPDASATIRDGVLELRVALVCAADAIAAAGRREAPMARTPVGPRTVVDRPVGVPSMRAIEEREKRRRDG